MKLLARSLFFSAALALALGLAGCGGGSDPVDNPPGDTTTPLPGDTTTPPPDDTTTPPPDDTTTPPPDDTPPPNNDPYVIDYYGDSTIWGWATGSNGARVETPAPLAFANRLPSPPQNEVRNEGVNGTTACGLLEGDGVHPPWSEQMQASNATHVIINHAINDHKTYSVTRYSSCLSDLAATARSNGKQLVFETPNPISAEGLGVYAEAMRSVAAAQQPPAPLIDQHQFLLNHLDGRPVVEIAPDGEHPTQEVYIMKGEFAADEFMRHFPR